MTDAERITDLEERVAYLEGELGLSINATRLGRLMAFGMQCSQAHIALALYQANGRVLSADQLDDALPTGEREPRNFVKVAINRVRGAIGADCIETVNGLGYRATDVGRERLAAILAIG